MQKYKLKFNYTSKETLAEQLISLSYFEKKVDENNEYKFSTDTTYILSIFIEFDGIEVHNYAGKGWLFVELERMIGKNYNDLMTTNLSTNQLYAFEKLDITKKWIELNILTVEELKSGYQEEFTSNSYWYHERNLKIDCIQRWFKNKNSLSDEEFTLVLSILKTIPLLIRTMPLNKIQKHKLEALSVHDNAIANELLRRRVLEQNSFSKEFFYEVLSNNVSNTIKELVNKIHNHEDLVYILEHNKLGSDKVNNIIQKKTWS